MGGFGRGPAGEEFMPRWAQWGTFVPSSDLAPGQTEVRVLQANSYDLTAAVSSATGGPLRFTSFYFPGWRVVLDGEQILRPYPSTDLGLLTVDLPPGSHALQLSWSGTTVQHWAAAVSLLALAGLTWFSWCRGRCRWLAVFPSALLVGGLAVAIIPPALSSVQAPSVSLTAGGVSLEGFRTEFKNPRYLLVYPYWYVHTTPSATFRARWQLRNNGGDVVGETTTRPYFNSMSASNWPPGTLVDDAYQLALAPGLSAGTYQLTLQLTSDGAVEPQDPVLVGTVELSAPTSSQPPPTHPLAVRFSDAFLLAGYDVRSNGQLVTDSNDRPIPVRAGDSVEYTLALQALKPLTENYHSFVHLVDRLGQPLTKHDEIVGTFIDPSEVWDTVSQHADRHLLRIPKTAASGLYWPSFGLYDFETMERLQAWAPGATEPADDYRLPPLKVINPPSRSPQHRVSARFADMAVLLGYDLSLPSSGLRAGDTFTLTLYYRSETPTPTDYARFVHFYSPELGMASQQDSLPQDGNNPTWSWVPGEVVTDTVTLTVSENARPGKYALQMGLYNPSDGMRLPVRDRADNSLPDGQVILTEVSLLP